MSRVQLALNVSDLDQAIEFYAKLFHAEPAKVRPGYANFAIADPPLKLVLIEQPDGVGARLNHLGVEVETTDEVAAATRRLAGDGLETAVEEQTTCCFAVQDKVWVADPDGADWEVYTVLADAEQFGAQPVVLADGSSTVACCATAPATATANATDAATGCC